jgi:hypothetical protein
LNAAIRMAWVISLVWVSRTCWPGATWPSGSLAGMARWVSWAVSRSASAARRSAVSWSWPARPYGGGPSDTPAAAPAKTLAAPSDWVVPRQQVSGVTARTARRQEGRGPAKGLAPQSHRCQVQQEALELPAAECADTACGPSVQAEARLREVQMGQHAPGRTWRTLRLLRSPGPDVEVLSHGTCG